MGIEPDYAQGNDLSSWELNQTVHKLMSPVVRNVPVTEFVLNILLMENQLLLT